MRCSSESHESEVGDGRVGGDAEGCANSYGRGHTVDAWSVAARAVGVKEVGWDEDFGVEVVLEVGIED